MWILYKLGVTKIGHRSNITESVCSPNCFTRREQLFVYASRKTCPRGACAPPPTFLIGGGGQWYVCAPPPPHTHTFNPTFLFSTWIIWLYNTDKQLFGIFQIYQLIILCTISINWHRWLILNNHTSKYNSFILVLYRRYINYVSVCPPPPHFLAPCYAIV